MEGGKGRGAEGVVVGTRAWDRPGDRPGDSTLDAYASGSLDRSSGSTSMSGCVAGAELAAGRVPEANLRAATGGGGGTMRAATRHVIPQVDTAWVAGLSAQFLLAASVAAQPTGEDAPPYTIPDTEVRFVTAESNGVEYKLYVGLPNGYDEEDRRYPVIFTLDADYSFAIAQNVVEHLADRNHLRPAIVVGIAYAGPLRYRLNRTRDYTPTFSADGGYGPEYQQVSGGAPAFLDFIDRTLIPWLTREYRTTDERILVGHSYGGLFVSWLAVTRPELFAGLVAVSPSLWYDDGMIFELEKQAARTRDDLPLRLYLEVGDQEVNGLRDMPSDLARFGRALEARRYPSLALRWNVADNETHNSIFPRALSNGLRFVLQGR